MAPKVPVLLTSFSCKADSYEFSACIHRLHFAFTATFHYIFPQLTMGLALLIVVLKIFALVGKDDSYEDAARFWTRG